MRCKDCRHWSNQKGSTTELQYERFWKRQTMDDWGVCELHGSEGTVPINSWSLAVPQDMEEYAAELWTHKTFGCVQAETNVG